MPLAISSRIHSRKSTDTCSLRLRPVCRRWASSTMPGFSPSLRRTSV